MTARTALGSLERLAGSAPRAVAAGVRLVTKTALSNARAAREELGSLVKDRQELASDLAEGTGSGSLDRISPEQCRELLGTRTVGRLAYIARAGRPDIVPVNYLYDGTAVLVRSGPGPKYQAAERNDVVAFEVDDLDERKHLGWSVVVHGVARPLTAHEAALYDGPQPWARGPRRHTIRIEVERIEGRRLAAPDLDGPTSD